MCAPRCLRHAADAPVFSRVTLSAFLEDEDRPRMIRGFWSSWVLGRRVCALLAAQDTLRTLSASREVQREGFSSGQRHSRLAPFLAWPSNVPRGCTGKGRGILETLRHFIYSRLVIQI